MAASSSTAVNPDENYYSDVFINYRGSDVKKTFADYLYRRLLSHGLSVFLDQQEFQQGENLTCQIEGAIRSAFVHVTIFFAGNAHSKWCLNELLLMLDSKAYIIPVFYNVKPVDLRWTRGKDGVYAQALEKLEKKRTYALSLVAEEISGFELDDEREQLDKVVERVTKKVKKPDLDVAKYPSMDEKVKDFENTVLLQQEQSGKRQIFGIVRLEA